MKYSLTNSVKRGLLFCVILLSTLTSYAQTGTIKGFVYDKADGEPMIFTNVLLEGTKMGSQTDVNGFFSITQIPPGTYKLVSTLIGYDTFSTTITVKENSIISKKLFLSQAQTQLQAVEITARRTEKITQINAGTITVTPREMKMLPSTGGEPDIAQYLQVVPGVIFTGDQGGQLYIRGGSPTQTGILLDGITIYNPFHSIGLYSIFETDAIRNVDIQTAGFNAQYGNRTSAIVDVTTKDGNKNRLAGKASVSPIMARAMLEGPIVKPKREGAASSTFLISAKHSYFDKTSKSIYGSLGEPFETGLPYSFTDIYGKVTLNADNGSKLNLFGFNFDDKAKTFDTAGVVDAEFGWKARGAGATFVITPGTSSALIKGRFAYSNYFITADELNFRPRSSGIDGFEGGIEFTYFLPGYSQLKYGIEVSGFHTELDYANSQGLNTTLDRRNTLGALYVMYRKNFGDKFIFEPGFRLQYYSALAAFTPEPRLGMKYNITPGVRLKFASGLYSQNILSTKSDIDIVNFFTGFVLSPDQAINNTAGQRVNTNLQRAYHVLGGIEVDINNNVELNLEPWYKNFNQNIELSRVKVNVQDPDFTAGSGVAYGVDLSARYNQKRVYLWGVVSYQQINYKTLVLDGNKITNNGNQLTGVTEVQEYPAPFDRRININLLASYTAGKKRDWELSARFNYGSPFPFTQTQGFYEKLNVQQNGIQTNYLSQNGQIGVLYANDINGGRLSHYHRLDISAKKRFEFTEYVNLETTLSLTNVYNRNNIFYIQRLNNQRVFQLPLFPSLNATLNF